MKIIIINSKGHWLNGWAAFPSSLNIVVKVLQKANCQVFTEEVASLDELHQVLDGLDEDTLVWANAYWVNGENGEEHGLIEEIEKRQFPMVGSGSKTLMMLLEKDTCQQMLTTAQIPIPSNLIIRHEDFSEIPTLINNSDLNFPAVIKPTKESRSMGVTKVNTKAEAIQTTETLGEKYPNGNIIIEEFLPTDDVTCGYLKLGEEIIMMPSYNFIKGMDCSTEIFSEEHYKLPVSYTQQVIIREKNILEQLQEYVPKIIEQLNIPGATRVDARLDKAGTLKFFDINGMPGLNYPTSALVKQCFTHFPDYEENYLFECLINTMVAESLIRNDMAVPTSMQEHNLFKLKSDSIVKVMREGSLSAA